MMVKRLLFEAKFDSVLSFSRQFSFVCPSGVALARNYRCYGALCYSSIKGVLQLKSLGTPLLLDKHLTCVEMLVQSSCHDVQVCLVANLQFEPQVPPFMTPISGSCKEIGIGKEKGHTAVPSVCSNNWAVFNLNSMEQL